MVTREEGSKKYIKEIRRLVHLWTGDSPFQNLALKTIHLMLVLLLQRSNKNSKAKVHVVALEWRLELWGNGNIIELLNEGVLIQERLSTGERSEDIAKIFDISLIN